MLSIRVIAVTVYWYAISHFDVDACISLHNCPFISGVWGFT